MKNYKKPKIEIIESICDEVISCSGPLKVVGIEHHNSELTSYEDGDGTTF